MNRDSQGHLRRWLFCCDRSGETAGKRFALGNMPRMTERDPARYAADLPLIDGSVGRIATPALSPHVVDRLRYNGGTRAAFTG